MSQQVDFMMRLVGYQVAHGKFMDIQSHKQLVRDNAHLIIEFSQEGGILNAANI